MNLEINSNIITHKIPILFLLDFAVIIAILNTQMVIKTIMVDKVSFILIPSDNPPHIVFTNANNMGRAHSSMLFLNIIMGVIVIQINIIIIL